LTVLLPWPRSPTNMGCRVADLLRPSEVADRLRVSVRQVQALAAEKTLPAIKVGSVWRFDPADLDAWILRQKNKCRPTYSVAAIRGTGVTSSPASSSASAYEQAIFGKREPGSKRSVRKPSAKPSEFPRPRRGKTPLSPIPEASSPPAP